MNIKADVEVKDVPEMTAIYLRHLGSYDELGKMFPGAIKKLVDFGIKNKLMIPGETKLFAIYHDNPNITTEDKLKTSICLSVPPDTKPDDEFGKMEIPAGKYAAGHFELDNAQQHSEAWTYMYGEWLPGSGFESDDGFNYEVYLNDPNTHPQRKHLIDIYIPVKAV